MLGLAFLLWLLLLLVSANRRVKEGDCRVGGRIKDWLLHCSHQSCPGPGTLPWHFTLAAATGSNLKLSWHSQNQQHTIPLGGLGLSSTIALLHPPELPSAASHATPSKICIPALQGSTSEPLVLVTRGSASWCLCATSEFVFCSFSPFNPTFF